MASITVRNVDEGLMRRLRIRAAESGRSMEEEARAILRTALNHRAPAQIDLARAIRARFAPLGGMELDIPPRSEVDPNVWTTKRAK